jgi:hypothetical protein
MRVGSSTKSLVFFPASGQILLLGNVVLLLEQVTLDLRVLELLQVAICKAQNY